MRIAFGLHHFLKLFSHLLLGMGVDTWTCKEFMPELINLLVNNCDQTTACGELAFPTVHQDPPPHLHASLRLAWQGQGVQVFAICWLWTKGSHCESERMTFYKVHKRRGGQSSKARLCIMITRGLPFLWTFFQVIYVGRNVKDICVSSFYHDFYWFFIDFFIDFPFSELSGDLRWAQC